MDASSRARSVGVVALGNFKSGIISAEQVRIHFFQLEFIALGYLFI